MNIKRILPLSSLFVILIVLVVLFFTGDVEKPLLPDPVAGSDDQGDAPTAERPTRTVTLFFLSEGDYLLHPEEREIISYEQTVFEAKQTLEELVRGSSTGALASLPSGTRLREMYIAQDGVAYVDFSRELKDNHSSGTSAEIATVFAIVNSLTYNFKTIKRVFILIEGNERETLSGHIDLTRPLLPRPDLIANRPSQ